MLCTTPVCSPVWGCGQSSCPPRTKRAVPPASPRARRPGVSWASLVRTQIPPCPSPSGLPLPVEGLLPPLLDRRPLYLCSRSLCFTSPLQFCQPLFQIGFFCLFRTANKFPLLKTMLCFAICPAHPRVASHILRAVLQVSFYMSSFLDRFSDL